jgi:hypothetical protein
MYEEIPTKNKLKQLIIQRKRKIIRNNFNYLEDSQSNPIKKKSIINDGRTSDETNKKEIKIIKNKYKITRKSKSSIKLKSKNHRNSCSQKNSLIDKKSIFKITKKQIKKKNKVNIPLIKNNEIEYDEMPLSMALRIDKRGIIYMLFTKTIEKIEIIDIFVNRKIKAILLSKYILLLLIELTMNSLLYSDQIVSHKRHNNGRLDSAMVFLLSFLSNILSSIIGYYLNILIGFEDKLQNIKDIKKEIIFFRVLRIILREVVIRIIIFFIIQIIIILFCSYYLFIFFTVYHKSQMSMLYNYAISLIEGLTINICVALFVTIFRKIGICSNNIYIYNISKYLDKNF